MEKQLKFEGSIFINKNGEGFLGEGRYQLLKLIDQYESISKAARIMNMSYKTAWDHIQDINNLAKEPVVITQAGGKHGGYTILTKYGKELLTYLDQIQEKYRKFLELLEEGELEYLSFVKRLDVKLSARNQIFGNIKSINNKGVISEVFIHTRSNNIIKSIITTKAVEALNLTLDKEVIAIIKSTNVILGVEETKAFEHENIFKGVVRQIIDSSEKHSMVKVDIGDELIIESVVDKETLKDFDVKQNQEIFIVIKASDVMIYAI